MSTVNELNKINWKLSIGLELTETEKQNYVQNINEFINNSQALLDQKQYAITLSLNAMADTEAGQSFLADINAFYSNSRTELARLGTELQTAINESFEDGLLDFNENQKIIDIQRQMAEINEAIAKSKFDAKMDALEIEYSGAELTGETFGKIQEQLGVELAAVKAEHNETLVLRLAEANLLRDKGGLGAAEYDKIVGAIKSDHFTNVGDTGLKSHLFQMETIMQTYGAEITEAIPKFSEMFANEVDYMISDVLKSGMGSSLQYFGENIDFVFSGMIDGLDQSTRANLTDLFEQMKPTTEQNLELRNACIESGSQIPEGLDEGILESSVLGALVGDVDSIYRLLGASFSDSPEYQRMLSQVKEQGMDIPEQLIAGAGMKRSELEQCGEDIANPLLKKVIKWQIIK